MCGIFGIILRNTNQSNVHSLLPATNDLLLLSQSRGKEAAGVMTSLNNTIHVYKEPVGASVFIHSTQYRELISDLSKSSATPLCIIGQTRLATNGLQTQNVNNQPVVTDNTIGVHNGIIVNDKKLWSTIKKAPRYEVDTEIALEMINTLVKKNYSYKSAICKLYNAIEGSATLAMMFSHFKNIILTTNTGSLYYVSVDGNIAFASEELILRTWMKRHSRILTTQTESAWSISHLKAGSGILVPLSNADTELFQLNSSEANLKMKNTNKKWADIIDHSDKHAKAEAKVLLLYNKKNSLEKLKKHDFNYDAIYALRRCKKCILPETTPFITFDDIGVCNYCREHKKIVYKGKDSLEALIAPYRSHSDKPDCIIAFSGGRDSSYGLHYLKNELHMNPIAYTYDWGMVKDIARRNEARMVGKLGIEHIIVSADITMKRNHIRQNILAWLKKPDLGMVPLFMEGDKQCEFYADKLAKQNDIKLVFYCRGNELEKEEFKTGQCGIKNADPGGVIHNLSIGGKMKLAAYYAKQYITNPSYINTSIADTAFAYYSTYVQKHNYIFLWHYIPWDESTIISTLKQNYSWETAQETIQTWRTGDGTPPFYNYIYYTGQGFTENDSFRSHQIREGLLNRKTAVELVNEENRPQYEALQWYFDQIGLDGDEVLSVIDRIPLKR